MSVFGKAGISGQQVGYKEEEATTAGLSGFDSGTLKEVTADPLKTGTIHKRGDIFAKADTNPLVKMPSVVVTDADIDKIGESVSRDIGATTQKIIDKMVVGKFDDLGVILTSITTEVDKLDPASIEKGGVVGWITRKFGDVKGTLTLRLKSAQDVFAGLEGKISMHITTQQEWLKDLESLYNENFTHYQKIVAEMASTRKLIAYVDDQIKNWPEIDLTSDTAAMQAQGVRDAQGKLNRLRLKLDNLERLKAMTELNSPKIRQQQETSRGTISTLKDIISQTIPIVKMEFALFIQTLDTQKSIKLTTEVRTLATKTLIRGGDSAKLSAIESAKALNTPVITSETLQTLRSRVLETVVEVKRIEADAQTKRETEAAQIVEGQKTLLTALMQSGKI